jgi:hypothetical protein
MTRPPTPKRLTNGTPISANTSRTGTMVLSRDDPGAGAPSREGRVSTDRAPAEGLSAAGWPEAGAVDATPGGVAGGVASQAIPRGVARVVAGATAKTKAPTSPEAFTNVPPPAITSSISPPGSAALSPANLALPAAAPSPPQTNTRSTQRHTSLSSRPRRQRRRWEPQEREINKHPQPK